MLFWEDVNITFENWLPNNDQSGKPAGTNGPQSATSGIRVSEQAEKKKEENAKAMLLPSTALFGVLSNIFYSSQCSVFLFSLYLTLQVSQFPEEISAMFGPPAGQMFFLCSP